MNKESFPTDGTEKNGTAPHEDSAAKHLIERRAGDRRTLERRTEERRTLNRRDDADRRGEERRFLTMDDIETSADTSEKRRETGLWPSMDWRPGDNRAAQRRDSERRIEDRRAEDRRKNDRRTRGRRASDHREDLYHGQIELDEDIDDLAEAGDYKGGSD